MSLFYPYYQSSQGMATPIRDIPRDVLLLPKSNVKDTQTMCCSHSSHPIITRIPTRREQRSGVDPHTIKGQKISWNWFYCLLTIHLFLNWWTLKDNNRLVIQHKLLIKQAFVPKKIWLITQFVVLYDSYKVYFTGEYWYQGNLVL